MLVIHPPNVNVIMLNFNYSKFKKFVENPECSWNLAHNLTSIDKDLISTIFDF